MKIQASCTHPAHSPGQKQTIRPSSVANKRPSVEPDKVNVEASDIKTKPGPAIYSRELKKIHGPQDITNSDEPTPETPAPETENDDYYDDDTLEPGVYIGKRINIYA